MKTLIITGDDGYKSIGLRLIAQIFKDTYKVTIVATKQQQSGVGGGLKSYGTKEWGFEKVDGIDSYWVDGTPSDAMEFAQGYFPKGFDYLISGINWGENIGLSLVTASGTGGGALRGLGLGVAPKVICMSWMRVFIENVEADWYHKETREENTESYLKYPGEAAKTIVNEIIKNDFWGKRIVNVNFPDMPTSEYKVTSLIKNLTDFYLYPVIIKENTYSYDEVVYNYTDETKNDTSVDAGAILSGYISVTPFEIC
jgi:5'/3'-nucleotidase SurE